MGKDTKFSGKSDGELSKFSWKSDDELADISRVSVEAHVVKRGSSEYFDSAKITAEFHNRIEGQEFKKFLMRNVNKLDSIPKLVELPNGQVQVAFSTYSPELCKSSLEKLGESDLPEADVVAACSTLKLDGASQGQKKGMSR